MSQCHSECFRGDSQRHYPPLGSTEWRHRMLAAEFELKAAQREIASHWAAVHKTLTNIFNNC